MLLPDQLAGKGEGPLWFSEDRVGVFCMFQRQAFFKVDIKCSSNCKAGVIQVSFAWKGPLYCFLIHVNKQVVGSPDSEICEQTTMPSGRSC